jgi:hypothetical protein
VREGCAFSGAPFLTSRGCAAVPDHLRQSPLEGSSHMAISTNCRRLTTLGLDPLARPSFSRPKMSLGVAGDMPLQEVGKIYDPLSQSSDYLLGFYLPLREYNRDLVTSLL